VHKCVSSPSMSDTPLALSAVPIYEPVENEPALGILELCRVDKPEFVCKERDFEPLFHHRDPPGPVLSEKVGGIVAECCGVSVGRVV
jgi:hypothetical protein